LNEEGMEFEEEIMDMMHGILYNKIGWWSQEIREDG